MRRPNGLDLHRATPFGCGGNRPAVGTKADQIRLVTELLATELTNIVFAAGSHFGRSGVPDMRIVRPHDGLAVGAMKRQQVLQGFEHVTVAQIPRRARTVIHDPIIALRISHQTSILLGIEEPLAIVLGVGPTFCQEIGERTHHVGFAGRIGSGQRRMTVGRRDRAATASGNHSVRERPSPIQDRPHRDSSGPIGSNHRGCKDQDRETRRACPSPPCRCACAAS